MAQFTAGIAGCIWMFLSVQLMGGYLKFERSDRLAMGALACIFGGLLSALGCAILLKDAGWTSAGAAAFFGVLGTSVLMYGLGVTSVLVVYSFRPLAESFALAGSRKSERDK